MRIALAQLRATTEPQQNLNQVVEALRRARDRDAELVVLPEAMMCSFLRPSAEVAEPLDGAWATAVRAAAAELGITAVVGMFTTAADHRVQCFQTPPTSNFVAPSSLASSMMPPSA